MAGSAEPSGYPFEREFDGLRTRGKTEWLSTMRIDRLARQWRVMREWLSTKTRLRNQDSMSQSRSLFLLLTMFVGVCIVLVIWAWPRKGAMPLPRIDVAPTGTLNCASFPSKVWVHRVNTLERAELVLQRFNGIEIDV